MGTETGFGPPSSLHGVLSLLGSAPGLSADGLSWFIVIAAAIAVLVTARRAYDDEQPSRTVQYRRTLNPLETTFIDDSLKVLVDHLDTVGLSVIGRSLLYATGLLAFFSLWIGGLALIVTLTDALRSQIAQDAARGMERFVMGPQGVDPGLLAIGSFAGFALALAAVQNADRLSPRLGAWIYIYLGWNRVSDQAPTEDDFRGDIVHFVRKGTLRPERGFDPARFLRLAFRRYAGLINAGAIITATLTGVSLLFATHYVHVISQTETRHSPYFTFALATVPHGALVRVERACHLEPTRGGEALRARYTLVLPQKSRITLWTERFVAGPEFETFETIHAAMIAAGVSFTQGDPGGGPFGRPAQPFSPDCNRLLRDVFGAEKTSRIFRMLTTRE